MRLPSCRNDKMIKVNGLEIEPIVGLEVHVQLHTRTKMFCNCPVEFGAPANSRVCPVCLGLPGALPVINRAAVEHAIRAALALNCRIAEVTRWDRKNYYYPDLPKNYQISQYDQPISFDGYFEFPFDGRVCRIGITRAHLEEDAGKNIHDLPGFSGIDLNRAGTPLLEIVSEPDLHSADQAREFAVQLQRLVRYLDVSEANMQRGQMRFEPNINVKIIKDGREYRTPIVEVKNLNSFRSLHGAISHEIQRQVEQWQKTGETAVPGNKSNRGWDDINEVTVPQREKEEVHDYRYFPDPDLVPLTVERVLVKKLTDDIPELPIARTQRFIREFHIPAKDAHALVDDRATADLLDATAAAGGHKPTLTKHFLGFWSRYANERKATIAALGLSPNHMAELANLVHAGQINATAAAQIAVAILETNESPTMIADKLGLRQSHDEDQIKTWVNQVLDHNQKAVHDALEDQKKAKSAHGYLTGQVMRLSGGKADPHIAGRLIDEKLKGLRGNT